MQACARSLGVAKAGVHIARTPARVCTNAISPKSQPFDEGAAQVAALLKRDEKELTGKESIGSSAFQEFGAIAGAETDVDTMPEAFRAKGGERSPFATSKAASPFGDSDRFSDNYEPANMSPTMESDPLDKSPWWTKITLTQYALVFSFSTITLLMLATCVFVWNTGAISLNDN